MSKPSSYSSVDHVLYQRKPAFQIIGHYGVLAVRTFLIALGVMSVVGLTMMLMSPSVPLAHAGRWGAYAAYQSMYGASHPWCWSMMGWFVIVGVNGVLLHRLFCHYAKGHVFSIKNTRLTVALSLLNLFCLNKMVGILFLVASILFPSHDQDTPKADA